MLNRLFFTCLLLASLAGRSQQNKIDSLLPLLKKFTSIDSNRLNVFINLADYYDEIDVARGHKMADSAIDLAQKLGIEKKTGTVHLNKSKLYYYDGAYRNSIAEAQMAIDIFKKLKDFAALERCHFMIGKSYYSLAAYRNAIKHHDSVALYASKISNKKMEATAYNSIGANYFQLTEYAKAIEFYYKALSIAEALKDSTVIGLSNSNIGLVYKRMGKLDKALPLYEKALEIFYLINNKAQEAETLMKIGAIYDTKNENQEALTNFKRAHAINEAYGFKSGLAETMSNIGIGYATMNNMDSALVYLLSAEKLNKALGNVGNLSAIYPHLSAVILNTATNVLIRNNILPKKKYQIAEIYLKKGLLLSQEYELLYSELEANKGLFQLFQKFGRYKEAAEISNKIFVLQDSVFADEKKEEIVRAEVQYEFEKQQAILQASHTAKLKQQKTVRNFLMGGAGLLLLSGSVLFWSYKRRTESKTKQQEAELKAQISDTETKVLRLQMNPHFIFNSLNSVSDYIRKNETEEADAYLTKFAKAMRMTLENSEEKEIPLADDLKALELYMQLEAKRLNHKFTYEIKVDEGINPDTTMVPPLLFQPFVENSIWHGIAQKEGQGHISVQIQQDGDMLRCIIEDNGVGRGKKLPAEKRSLGMKITKARIDMLNQTTGSNASVSIKDKSQGVIAELRLPLSSAV